MFCYCGRISGSVEMSKAQEVRGKAEDVRRKEAEFEVERGVGEL